jgi:hypothetical protein
VALEDKVISQTVQVDVVIVEGKRNYLGRRTLARYEDGVRKGTEDGYKDHYCEVFIGGRDVLHTTKVEHILDFPEKLEDLFPAKTTQKAKVGTTK